jgi:hypothetical protein
VIFCVFAAIFSGAVGDRIRLHVGLADEARTPTTARLVAAFAGASPPEAGSPVPAGPAARSARSTRAASTSPRRTAVSGAVGDRIRLHVGLADEARTPTTARLVAAFAADPAQGEPHHPEGGADHGTAASRAPMASR